MQCDEIYLSLLSGHIDRCNSEEEEKLLQAHLDICPHCRNLLAQMEQNDALLAQSTALPPADLTQRIMTTVGKEKKKRKRFWFSTAAAGLATAALLCFALLGDGLPKLPDATSEISSPTTQKVPEPDGESPVEITADTQGFLPEKLEELPPTEVKAPPAHDVQSSPDGNNFYVAPPEEKSVLEAPQPPQQVYGATGAGDVAPDESGKPSRGPVRRELKLPTLVLWGVKQDELLSILDQELTPLEQFSGACETQSSPYCGFLAGLPLSEQLLSMNASPFQGQAVEHLDATVVVYQISYEELCDLFIVLGGSVELCLYFPDHYTDAENCQLIVIQLPEEE